LKLDVAVIGAGIIAFELGQTMRTLGVRVASFNPFGELSPFTDPEVKRVVRHRLVERFGPRCRCPSSVRCSRMACAPR